MDIEKEVNKFDDAHWVEFFAKSRGEVIKELSNMSREEIESQLADYICMTSTLISTQKEQQKTVASLLAAVNHPTKAGKVWVIQQ